MQTAAAACPAPAARRSPTTGPAARARPARSTRARASPPRPQAFASWPASPASAAAAWASSLASLVRRPCSPHPRDRLTRLHRDPFELPFLIMAPAHPRGIARLRIEQHHVRGGDGRRELDDPALALRRRGALVLLHHVHALHDDPELLRVDVEDLAFFALVFAADDADDIALGDVELVALGDPARLAPRLLVNERLHIRSLPARATRSS